MERITRKQITFKNQFVVGDLSVEQPAGSYEVELIEELVGLSSSLIALSRLQ
jgi:hypothetical protein